MTIELRSHMRVDLVQFMGSDELVAAIARVSTLGPKTPEYIQTHGADPSRLLTFLMRNRHGSPFEHNSMTFYVEAPLFVVQEFLRHRVGFSYNQESARYRELKPAFWVPAGERNLYQVGKPGHYRFLPGTAPQHCAKSSA